MRGLRAMISLRGGLDKLPIFMTEVIVWYNQVSLRK